MTHSSHMENNSDKNVLNNASPQHRRDYLLKKMTIEENEKNYTTKPMSSMKLEKIVSGFSALSGVGLTSSALVQNLPQGYKLIELICAGYSFSFSAMVGIKYLIDKERMCKVY